MIIPWVRIVWISDEMGYGLFATRPIKKGTVTFVQDSMDIVVPAEQVDSVDEKLLESLKKYAYEDFLGNLIVSWDLGKYMNHNDEANTLSTGFGFEIAVRDIAEGEEVTDDYRIFSTHHNTTTWHMGPPSTDLKPWPVDLLANWNTKCRNALKNINKVEQPLGDFVDSTVWEKALLLEKDDSSYPCVSEAFPLKYKLHMSIPKIQGNEA